MPACRHQSGSTFSYGKQSLEAVPILRDGHFFGSMCGNGIGESFCIQIVSTSSYHNTNTRYINFAKIYFT